MLESLAWDSAGEREMPVLSTGAWDLLRLRGQGREIRRNQPRRRKRKASEVIRGRWKFSPDKRTDPVQSQIKSQKLTELDSRC